MVALLQHPKALPHWIIVMLEHKYSLYPYQID
jgi:hypothetical protein